MAETNLPAPKKQAVTVENMLRSDKTAKAFKEVSTTYLSGDKMVRLCINAIRKTPELMNCDPATVLGAMMTSASLGLEPNTPLGQAYLIPYKGRKKVGNEWVNTVDCQFQIGYKGMLALAHRNPKVVSIQAEAIRREDHFEHCIGSETFLRFRKTLTERGDLIGSFCHVVYQTEYGKGEIVMVLPLAEIEKSRDNSQTYRSLKAQADSGKDWAKKKLAESPWVKWEDQMAAKTAIRRAFSQIPVTPDLAIAANLDSTADDGGVDWGAMADPEFAASVIEGDAEPINEGGEEDAPTEIEKPKPTPRKKPGSKKTKDPEPEPEPEADAEEEPPHDPETGEVEEPQEDGDELPGDMFQE